MSVFLDFEDIKMRVRIKELAQKNGTTFKKLAAKMQITTRSLYRWNTGEMMPSRSNMLMLKEILNCNPSDLIEF